MRNRQLYFLFALAALIFFLSITKNYGVGITTDSVYFLDGAKSLAEGKGYIDYQGSFINHWPPLYSVILAIFTTVFAITIQEAALAFNALCFTAFIIVFLALCRQLKFSLITQIILGSLLLLARLNELFLFMWTEGLYIVLLLACLFFLFQFQKNKAFKYVLFAGIFAGLSLLTRYAGVGFIAGFCLWLFYHTKGGKLKLKTISLFVLPIAMCLMYWFTYAYSFKQEGIDRPFVLHLVDSKTILNGIKTIYHWFYPQKWGWLLFLLSLLCMVRLITFKGSNFQPSEQKTKTRQLLWLSIGTYLLFLLFSISFLDAYTPLNDRMLAPLYPFLLLLIGYLFRFKTVYSASFSIGLAMLLLLGILVTAVPVWRQHFLFGNGYNGQAYQNLEVLTKSAVSKSKVTYSNAPDFLLLYGFQNPTYLPRREEANSKQMSARYEEEIDKMQREIINGSAQLLYVNQINWRPYLIPVSEISSLFPNKKINTYPSGFIID